MNNVFKLLDKTLPLISTLLGAWITYFITVLSKRNEFKLKAQTKARDDCWIPCSIAITNLQKKIVELTNKGNTYVSFSGIDSCERELNEVLKFLQADKRIYFYERTRSILALLNDRIETYEKSVNDDVQSILDIYQKQYYSMISEFPSYKINNCNDCFIATRSNFYQRVKEGLLTGKNITWFGQVSHIEFIRDYHILIDSEMSYGSEEDIYYDVWLEIEQCGRTRAEFGLSTQQEFTLDILDYEYENFGRFINPLVEFVEGVNYQKEYTDIFDTLSCLQDEVLKNIDDVTIL